MNTRSIGTLAALAVAGCGGGDATMTQPLAQGEIIGSVEVSQGVGATGCLVLLEGTPLGSRCDETGTFDIRRVPPGRWDLRLVGSGDASALPARRLAAASNPGQISDLGAVAIAKAGSVGGRVKNPPMDLSLAVIAVPSIGSVTSPNTNDGYLLDPVSPGIHDLVLIDDQGTVTITNVNVQPGKVTIGADFDLKSIASAMTPVAGFAKRSDQGDGGHGGITVDLVESLDGKIIDSTQSAADGSFQLAGKPGTYVVRAHDGSNPIVAIIPSVVLAGSQLTLTSSLVVTPQHGDLNGDGVPDDTDPDIDGDGVLNMMDAFPYDPAETKDTDGDGLGDRSDLRSMGGPGIDHHNDTPDTDGDGLLDFEDDCPKVANADQKDADGDGVGDACDDCPFVANPDQADSVGNGVGDACRSCKTNLDCGTGKLCQFGQCLQCLDSSQCNGEVCRAGACVACTADADCGGQFCGGAGRCVECLNDNNCGGGKRCVQNVCFTQCTVDANCQGGFCVMGACAQCRGNADCSGTEWCDGGACRPQCAIDGDCTGARTCDQGTHTCVLPCGAMCPAGEACDGKSVCRPLCDQARPCGAGMACSMISLCEPECAVNADCAAKPHTVCSAGACVPDGTCTLDPDCAASQLCTGGQCVPRPTALVQGKGYTCAGPCDCALGEACTVNLGDGMSYCVSEGVPNWFVSSTGNGSGKSPLAPSSLAAALAGLKAGDSVALDAGDSFTVGSAVTITASGARIAGGYAACGANRWVRDPGQRSKLTSSSKGLLVLAGTAQAPLTANALRNLDLAATDTTSGYTVLDTKYAPGLILDRLSVTLPSLNGYTTIAIAVASSDGVSLTNLSSPGMPGFPSIYTFLSLTTSSGTVDSVDPGPYTSSGSQAFGVHATASSGPLTLGHITIPAASVTSGGGIVVDGCQNGALTIANNTASYSLNPAGNGLVWAGISVLNCPNAQVTDNTIDGRAQTDHGSAGYGGLIGIHYAASSGTIARNNVYLPVATAPAYQQGILVEGPNATVTVDQNLISGGQAAEILGLETAGVTTGLVTFTKNTIALGPVMTYVYGFYSVNSNFVATDCSATVGQSVANSAYALYVDAGSNGRIERSKFMVRGTAAQNNAGCLVADQSQLELYSSYCSAGVSNNNTFGLYLYGSGQSFSAQLDAIGDTFDGGGQAGSGAAGYGLLLGNDLTYRFDSCLIDGGVSIGHTMLGAGNFQTGVAASFTDCYFQYRALGAVTPNDRAPALFTGTPGKPDAGGDMVGGATTCFDVASYPQPDYHIATSSPCVDFGHQGKRMDGSLIDQDVDGNARVLGAAADIGAHEVK